MLPLGCIASSTILFSSVHLPTGNQLALHLSLQYVFDYQQGDVFGCVADIGWITGHSYVVYGPLCNGGTTVLFESTPVYPDPGKGVMGKELARRGRVTRRKEVRNLSGITCLLRGGKSSVSLKRTYITFRNICTSTVKKIYEILPLFSLCAHSNLSISFDC